jgi:ribonuclease HI
VAKVWKLKYNVFPDGSHYKSRTVAAYCILIKDQVVAEEAIPLGIFPSVFQAEVVPILLAAEKLLEFADHGKIVIHSDSQAALQVLNNPVVTSQTVLAAMLNLDTFAKKQVISLWWVKAHVGHWE